MASRPVNVLGAVLAGGQSSRFGSDKALALFGGRTLIEHSARALAARCGQVVVVGREILPGPLAGLRVIPDRPRPGMGPLAGLAAALDHARAAGFDAVLSCPVDALGIDAGLIEDLGEPPAYVASQPVIGLWPAGAAPVLDRMLEEPGRHSLHAFVRAIGARPVEPRRIPANINTREDLAMAGREDG